jgi:hypothetical protein
MALLKTIAGSDKHAIQTAQARAVLNDFSAPLGQRPFTT